MVKNPLNKIIFYNENTPYSSGFKWYKGNYKIDEDFNLSAMHPKKITFFTPKIGNLIIDMANLEIENNNKVIEFVNKYGLLGLIDFYKNIYKKQSINEDLFSPTKYGIEHLHISDIFSNIPSPINTDNPVYKNYHEPLEYFKSAINDFKRTCYTLSNNFHKAEDIWDRDVFVKPSNMKEEEFISIMWNTEMRWIENYNSAKITLVNKQGKPTFAIPVNSLLDLAYSALAWNVGNGKIIKKCEATYRKKPYTCNNFFWQNGKQTYCSKRCTDRMAQYSKRY